MNSQYTTHEAKTATDVRNLLNRILSAWQECHEEITNPEGEMVDCPRCNGFLYIEQGGETVDCPVCDGTGTERPEIVLNHEKFSEKIETIMFHSDDTFFAILDPKTIITH